MPRSGVSPVKIVDAHEVRAFPLVRPRHTDTGLPLFRDDPSEEESCGRSPVRSRVTRAQLRRTDGASGSAIFQTQKRNLDDPVRAECRQHGEHDILREGRHPRFSMMVQEELLPEVQAVRADADGGEDSTIQPLRRSPGGGPDPQGDAHGIQRVRTRPRTTPCFANRADPPERASVRFLWGDSNRTLARSGGLQTIHGVVLGRVLTALLPPLNRGT